MLLTQNDPVVQWYLVGSSDKIKPDEPAVQKIGEKHIAVYRVGPNEFSAINDICTHEFASLSKGFIEGCTIECPLHQARFDIRTGKCLGPVAEIDLETYPVKIENGDIYVGIKS